MPLDYDKCIKYQSTDKISQSDALSRFIDSYHRQPEDSVVAAISVEPELSTLLTSTVKFLLVSGSWSHCRWSITKSCIPTAHAGQQYVSINKFNLSINVDLWSRQVFFSLNVWWYHWNCIPNGLQIFGGGTQGIKASDCCYVYWLNIDK